MSRIIRCLCRWILGWCGMRAGELQPKLVELQAFPSLYAYQGPLAEAYIEATDWKLRLASGFGRRASCRAAEISFEWAGDFFLSRTFAAGDCGGA